MSEEIKVLSVEEVITLQAPENVVVAVLVEDFTVEQAALDKAAKRLVVRIRNVLDKVTILVVPVVKTVAPDVPEGQASIYPICTFQSPKDSSKLLSSDMGILIDGDRISVLRGSELELGSVVA